MTRTKLTRVTGLSRTTRRDVIERLLEASHVREVPNPRDGRSTLLELTPAGQAICDQGIPVFHRALRKIDETLDGRLDEREEVVWQIRAALQSLVSKWSG